MKANSPHDLAGSCGLYCGLCNKYQSQAPSRCLGCQLGPQHAYCSIWNCCVKKHGFLTCAECADRFQCTIHLRRKVSEWIPAAANLAQIHAAGLESWLGEQEERQKILEAMLEAYNEGRSMSFYCAACARMPVEALTSALADAEQELAGLPALPLDKKIKAKALRESLQKAALENKTDLK